jgi:hypothetical protein
MASVQVAGPSDVRAHRWFDAILADAGITVVRSDVQVPRSGRELEVRVDI